MQSRSKIIWRLHSGRIHRRLILRCGTTGGISAPAYVNASGSTPTSSASVHTGVLPPSRVLGNLLIFFFKVRVTNYDPIVSADWTAIDTFGFGGSTFRYGAYYCYVTGSETAPTLTWVDSPPQPGGGRAVSIIAQYENVAPSAPVVPGTKHGAQTGTSITTSAATSSRDNSLFVSATWNDQNVACAMPAGFSNPTGVNGFDNLFGSLRLGDVVVNTTGSHSPAVATTQVTSVPWGTLLFEIRSAP